MRISVIGSGYVGIVTGMGFAHFGNEVIFVDVDNNKVDAINSGKPPIYERGLEELMKECRNNYRATNDYEETISNSDITFILVGTPSSKDGSINLKYVKAVSESVGERLKSKRFHVVVVKTLKMLNIVHCDTKTVYPPEIRVYQAAYKSF